MKKSKKFIAILMVFLSGCVKTDSSPTSMPNQAQNESEDHLLIIIEDQTFTATFADNSSADAFHALLMQSDLELTMEPYGGFEVVGRLDEPLPENNRPMTTKAGDITLHQGDHLSIYYAENAWSLTSIATMENIEKSELIKALSTSDVVVTFRLETGN